MEEQLKLKAATLEQRVRDGVAAARQEMLDARRAEEDSVRLRECTLRDELAMVRAIDSLIPFRVIASMARSSLTLICPWDGIGLQRLVCLVMLLKNTLYTIRC